MKPMQEKVTRDSGPEAHLLRAFRGTTRRGVRLKRFAHPAPGLPAQTCAPAPHVDPPARDRGGNLANTAAVLPAVSPAAGPAMLSAPEKNALIPGLLPAIAGALLTRAVATAVNAAIPGADS